MCVPSPQKQHQVTDTEAVRVEESLSCGLDLHPRSSRSSQLRPQRLDALLTGQSEFFGAASPEPGPHSGPVEHPAASVESQSETFGDV